MKKVGLTPLPSVKIKPPRVKESAVQFECKLFQTVEIGDGKFGSSTVVFGTVVLIHAADHVYENGKIIIEKLSPVGRLGGISYTKVSDIFDIPVPKV